MKSGKILKSIQPLGSTTVELSIATIEPGTYDLGSRLTISTTVENAPAPVVQESRVESSLVISNHES